MTTKEEQKVNGWISDLVGALTDPIICHPQWMESPPEKIRIAITLQRLIENGLAMKEKGTPLGTDAECAWYLSCTSLVGPLSSEWIRIYQYVFTKTCAVMQTEVPEELRQETLDNYEMGLLLGLKQWIYRTRSENRKDHDRAERREHKEKAEQEKIELQPKMFEF